jgi:alpha-L-rhamnosidase
LGVQSDCPHREKIQYGGDINADSPSALHFYDMSAFYRKVVYDWRDQQWDNGAFAGTSYWLALNDYAGIGDGKCSSAILYDLYYISSTVPQTFTCNAAGAGETVWATAPPLTAVRHFQHYGDLKLLEQTFPSHLKWFEFLRDHFDKGMKVKGYDEKLEGYVKEGSGLGDWLSFRGRDTWLTHESCEFYSGRLLIVLLFFSKFRFISLHGCC